MFRGLHEHSIDAKGRTQVPARFREVLAAQLPAGAPEQLVVTTGIDPCLSAYTPGQWSGFEARLAKLSAFDPAVVQLKRLVVAQASECDIDRHGRLLLPPLLRQYAGLGHDIVWAGMVDSLEIWARDAWEARLAASRGERAELGRAMAELGL